MRTWRVRDAELSERALVRGERALQGEDADDVGVHLGASALTMGTHQPRSA